MTGIYVRETAAQSFRADGNSYLKNRARDKQDTEGKISVFFRHSLAVEDVEVTECRRAYGNMFSFGQGWPSITDYTIAKLLSLPSTASPQGLMYISAFRLHPSAEACFNVLACLL